MGKTPTVSKLGRAKFLCPKEKKTYELDIIERRPMKHSDMLVAEDPQGHKVYRFAKKEG